METLAPTFIYRHTKIRITSERLTEFIDLTDGLEALIAEAGITAGCVNVQSLHTTAAVVVNEREPLLFGDFESLLNRVAPSDALYQHDDVAIRTVNLTSEERPNGHSHCKALMLGTGVCLNVIGGQLVLGRWQRVFLVELDGPRPRDISILMMGEGAR